MLRDEEQKQEQSLVNQQNIIGVKLEIYSNYLSLQLQTSHLA